MSKNQSTELQAVPLEDIVVAETQVRQYINEERLGELEASIKEYGILQPLLVVIEEGKHHLVAGHRRYQCAKNLNLETVPVHVVNGDVDALSLIENIQRQDLHPIDEAEGYQKLQEKHDYDQKQLGQIVNKAQNTISEILTLVNLPQSIKEEARQDSRWSRAKLLSIARKKTDEAKLKEFEDIKAQFDENSERKSLSKEQKKYNTLVSYIDGLESRIKNIELVKIKGKERKSFLNKLRELQSKISTLLEESS